MYPPQVPPFGSSPPPAGPPGPPQNGGYGNPPPPGGFGYGNPYGQEPRTHPLATVSLVCGIVSIPMCCCWGIGFPLEVASIVCGVIALQKIKTAPDQYRGSNQCIAGMICATVGLFFTLGWIFSTVSDTLKRKYGSGLGI